MIRDRTFLFRSFGMLRNRSFGSWTLLFLYRLFWLVCVLNDFLLFCCFCFFCFFYRCFWRLLLWSCFCMFCYRSSRFRSRFFARCLSRFHCFLQSLQIAYSFKTGLPFSSTPTCFFCKMTSFPHFGYFIIYISPLYHLL